MSDVLKAEAINVGWRIDYKKIIRLQDLKVLFERFRLSYPETWEEIGRDTYQIESTQIGLDSVEDRESKNNFFKFKAESFVAHRAIQATIQLAEAGAVDDLYVQIIDRKVQLFGIFFELTRLGLERGEGMLGDDYDYHIFGPRKITASDFIEIGNAIEAAYRRILKGVLSSGDQSAVVCGLTCKDWCSGLGCRHLILDDRHGTKTNYHFMNDVLAVTDKHIPSPKYGKRYRIRVNPEWSDNKLRYYPVEEREEIDAKSMEMPYIELSVPPAPTIKENPTRKLIHTTDYRTLSWNGHVYQLRSSKQSAIIEYLHKQFKEGGHKLHQATILDGALGESIVAERKRLNSYFRSGVGKQLWGDGLIRAEGDGSYSLDITE